MAYPTHYVGDEGWFSDTGETLDRQTDGCKDGQLDLLTGLLFTEPPIEELQKIRKRKQKEERQERER